MEVREVKFLLKLAGLPEYKGKISQLKPNGKTKIKDVEKICLQLRDRDFVACQEEITQFKLSSVGKALLQLDLDDLPLRAEELCILQAGTQNAIATSNIKITSARQRNTLINSLRSKGLITIIATKIKQVWLTDRGIKYLLQEYNPQGTNPILSLNLLKNYLHLFREKYSQSDLCPELIRSSKDKILNSKLKSSARSDSMKSHKNSQVQPISDRELLDTIVNLDRQLGTENYLPIFYLREKLQPPFLRAELDSALYRLQRQDKIELSSIVESAKYTREQMRAGIPQNVGGCLFFLIVNY